ncbi:hypothetical protein EW146_g796 [Bondarzewia mesenterica]|uniref:Uncharacterized protein n=1 Tax=Bondarzewia mesenterica TaxID=1095465 RepID=A0A4S4M5T4_9AGAM|nr:hypothetical protein EW146_g796 [Bondarzewia mesenterica]
MGCLSFLSSLFRNCLPCLVKRDWEPKVPDFDLGPSSRAANPDPSRLRPDKNSEVMGHSASSVPSTANPLLPAPSIPMKLERGREMFPDLNPEPPLDGEKHENRYPCLQPEEKLVPKSSISPTVTASASKPLLQLANSDNSYASSFEPSKSNKAGIVVPSDEASQLLPVTDVVQQSSPEAQASATPLVSRAGAEYDNNMLTRDDVDRCTYSSRGRGGTAQADSFTTGRDKSGSSPDSESWKIISSVSSHSGGHHFERSCSSKSHTEWTRRASSSIETDARMPSRSDLESILDSEADPAHCVTSLERELDRLDSILSHVPLDTEPATGTSSNEDSNDNSEISVTASVQADAVSQPSAGELVEETDSRYPEALDGGPPVGANIDIAWLVAEFARLREQVGQLVMRDVAQLPTYEESFYH